MKGIKSWVKDAFVKVIDPEREDRVKHLVNLFRTGLKAKREQFLLPSALANARVDYSERDLKEAKERVYRGVLEKLWKDDELSESDKHMTVWVARCLELPRDDAKSMNLSAAKACFSEALAEAMRRRTERPRRSTPQPHCRLRGYDSAAICAQILL